MYFYSPSVFILFCKQGILLFSILIIFLWNKFIFFVFIHARLLLFGVINQGNIINFSLLPLTTAALVCAR